MPTYEYTCLDCQHRVEYFQSMKEAPRTECPRCNGRLQRMVSSGAGLIFKGSGFYITDYKNKSGSTATSRSSESSTTSSDNKSDAKPEKAATEKKSD